MFFYLLLIIVAGLFVFCVHRGLLTAPKSSSFPFGSMKGVRTGTFEDNDKIYKEFRGKTPAAGTFTFIKPTLMVLDLELVKNILIRDFSTFQDRGFFYNKEDDPISVKYDFFFETSKIH